MSKGVLVLELPPRRAGAEAASSGGARYARGDDVRGAAAWALAARGDRVALHVDLGSPAAIRRAGAIHDSLPGDGHALVAADLSDPDQVRGMVQEAWIRLQGIDVLINVTLAQADLCLHQLMAVCVSTVRLMTDGGSGGVIVNVPDPPCPAPEHLRALTQLERRLRHELGSTGVMVNTLLPPVIIDLSSRVDPSMTSAALVPTRADAAAAIIRLLHQGKRSRARRATSTADK